METDITRLKKIAEGREAEMFEWDDGRVLRLYRPGEGLAAATEIQRLEIARSCGVRVPAEFGRMDVDGRSGFLIERIAGPDLLTEIDRKPWHLFRVGTIWGRVQADLNRRIAPPELETLQARCRRILERSTKIPADIKETALSDIESLPEGDHLLHGDCHPANIMRNGREFVVIDWSNVTRGPAEADYYRSYLMGTLGDLPPGTPRFIRTFARLGRRIVRGRFDSAYRKVLNPDMRIVRQWTLAIVAARIAEGIEPEFPALERLARSLINDRRQSSPVT